MKTSFIATYDYGSGGGLYRLFANSKAQVECLFPSPRWRVFAEGDEGCPDLSAEFQLIESDVDRPKEWLKKHVWSVNQHNLGRQPFYFELPKTPNSRYYEVWATSEKDVLRRVPELRSMMLRTMTGNMLDGITYCTVNDLQNHL